jgi:phosphohistidine swiveling domain-containing protein
MTEWLLSGHNTQETTGIARPVTATMSEHGLDAQFDFILERLGGNLAQFDRTVKSTMAVQGRLYVNMEYFARNMAAVIPFDPASIGVPPEMVKNLKHPSLGRQLGVGPRFYRLYKETSQFYRQVLPDLDQTLRQLYWRLRDGDDNATWELFEPDLYTRSRRTDLAHLVVSLFLISVGGTLRERAPDLLPLFAGQATTTSQMGQCIWDLRETAEACGPQVCQMLSDGVVDLATYRALPEAAKLVEGVDAFLKEYGHRGFRFEADFETERLADLPEHVLLSIGGQLFESEPPSVRAEAARQGALNALNKMNPVARMVWQRVLAWSQQLIAWREASKSNIALRQAAYGLAARKLARQFYADQPDDTLMFYTLDEFLAFVRSRGEQRIDPSVISARRAQHELHRSQMPPPELIRYDPDTGKWTPVQEREQGALKVMTTQVLGIPASAGPGPVEGFAMVTNDPLDAGQRLLQIRGPVVLVTRLTDPAWSSLFRRLTAVVTELGGVVSHAAIVARENGLPAVVGVPEVTRWVRDGQRLRVDGATGAVNIVD